MNRCKILIITLLWPLSLIAGHRIFHPQIKSLQAVVNQDFMSPAVLRLGTDDILHIAFDELSHDYHRYTYTLERCEADWTPAQGIFESDWLEGFNAIVIDDHEPSINTIVPYTHYQLQIPNDQCRLKMSGNYRLYIIDDEQQEQLACVEFMVTEQKMSLFMEATTNTDIDLNTSHQQLDITLNYGNLVVTNPQEQIRMVVRQNDRDDNCRRDIPPTFINNNGLRWQHCRPLIFEAGNEYRKYEVLDPSHPTMGIDYIRWDGEQYQVFPFISEPRPHYIYDEDSDGAFYIRNSDNVENDIASEYVWVNYRLKAPFLPSGRIMIQGHWTTEAPETYEMTYDATTQLYTASILQKQGYYSYQYLWLDNDGRQQFLPSEGSFYQTENRYQTYIYYKGTEDRTWRLVSYRQLIFK
jgi:hypothetical protein